MASPSTAATPTLGQAKLSPTTITGQSPPQGEPSVPRHQTWRVRGVPSSFGQTELADILEHHPYLQIAKEATANEVDHDTGDNNVEVHTLALDFHDQVATVRFRKCPIQLTTLERGNQLKIDVLIFSDNTRESVRRKQDSLQTVRLTIDQHFDGVTVLFAPTWGEHEIDVLAVSGLGSHAFGSFVHKGDGHMWLSKSLPKDLPTARVMTYGYESGLQHSTSFANLGDLASSLQIAVSRLLRSGKKRLVLIGHSLGGLLIKEALIRMCESDSDSDLIPLILGAVFFGVPNDGMDIESLIPMVNNQPNRLLLESLNFMNPQILEFQKRDFFRVLKRADLELFCFYETRQSRTAAKVSVFHD
jgi:hypothetical protein